MHIYIYINAIWLVYDSIAVEWKSFKRSIFFLSADHDKSTSILPERMYCCKWKYAWMLAFLFVYDRDHDPRVCGQFDQNTSIICIIEWNVSKFPIAVIRTLHIQWKKKNVNIYIIVVCMRVLFVESGPCPPFRFSLAFLLFLSAFIPSELYIILVSQGFYSI